MSYNPYASSTPPRPFRIMVGGTMAIAGLFFGMFNATYEFHKALLTENEPVEMTWKELAEEGYGENAYVSLVDVDVVEPDLDEFLDEESLRILEDEDLLEDEIVDALVGPIKVIPRHSDESTVPERIVIPQRMHLLDEAYRQIDETGALTGIVSTYTHEEMVHDLFQVFGYEGGPEETELDGDEDEPHDDALVYKIVPLEEDTDKEQAQNLFLLAGFMLSFGLILCGSGGPGIWTCWYAPIQSAISLVGYPMRYGRGGLQVRGTYIAVGMALMGFAYKLLVLDGQFGKGDGNPLLHALGFAFLFIGVAAVFAVPMQITFRALSASVEVQPRKKPVRMSWQQACSMEPVIQEEEYTDQTLAKIDTIPMSGELKEKAEALEQAGFTKPDHLQWQRDAGLAAATVQLGCQSMIVSDLEYDNESDIIETGLISILGTGMPVITVSANSKFNKHKPSTHCLFQRADSSDPTEMLAKHLELVVGEAESRDNDCGGDRRKRNPRRRAPCSAGLGRNARHGGRENTECRTQAVWKVPLSAGSCAGIQTDGCARRFVVFQFGARSVIRVGRPSNRPKGPVAFADGAPSRQRS